MKKMTRGLMLFFIISIIFINYGQKAVCSEIRQKKVVYLTFDDGPSFSNTDAILDILCENRVKATFCVVGENVAVNKGTMRRLNNLQMGIIPHCNCHEYKKIYSSSNDYLNDLKKCEEVINSTINEYRRYNFVRIPGGSTNSVCDYSILKEIKDELKKQKICYLDWTIDSGDTHSFLVEPNVIRDNILKNAGKNTIDIILMHDLENKTTTTEVLRDVIRVYKKLGYEFKCVDDMEEWEIKELINRGVINR